MTVFLSIEYSGCERVQEMQYLRAKVIERSERLKKNQGGSGQVAPGDLRAYSVHDIFLSLRRFCDTRRFDREGMFQPLYRHFSPRMFSQILRITVSY